jgi:hypothetical protein
MTNFPNLEFPVSNADCAEVEAIFIELMRARNADRPGEVVNPLQPLLDPYGNPMDLRSQ